MPLKIRLRPEEKFTIGENTIQNATHRKIDLIIIGPDRVRRDTYHEKLVEDKQ